MRKKKNALLSAAPGCMWDSGAPLTRARGCPVHVCVAEHDLERNFSGSELAGFEGGPAP